ncbi:MAG: hypothetical protein WBH83_11890 [Methanosarcina flavescens]
MVLKKPMAVNAICQNNDTMLWRWIGSIFKIFEKIATMLNTVQKVSLFIG